MPDVAAKDRSTSHLDLASRVKMSPRGSQTITKLPGWAERTDRTMGKAYVMPKPTFVGRYSELATWCPREYDTLNVIRSISE